jgi:hypothetical protein
MAGNIIPHPDMTGRRMPAVASAPGKAKTTKTA